jgi:DNA ligase-1
MTGSQPDLFDVDEAGSGASFLSWAETAEAIARDRGRLAKGALLAAYLAALDDEALPIAARWFAGTVFPRHDMRTVQIGGAIVRDALLAITGLDPATLRERFLRFGESGDLTGELLRDRPPTGITIVALQRWLSRVAATRGATARRALVRERLARLGGQEARFLVKLLGGELRIGLKEAQVEEAIARAFAAPLGDVRRANLLRGDVGEVAARARAGTLRTTTLSLFHPLGFMLAQPLATPAEIVAALPSPFVLEAKYDGIRAQAHVGPGRVALFSRTLDEISPGYPDVVAALASLGIGTGGLILDGELLAMDPAAPERPLPFRALQRRLGRKAPDAALLAEVPVALVVFDLLAADDALIIDETWEARRARLERLAWRSPHLRLAPTILAREAEDVEQGFAAAREAGHEGLLAKDPGSTYAPGRRGGAWFKLKRALASLDVVIVAAERGHGRRRAVLSDYTFAVRASEDDPTLLTVGKAYNGLTDAEIAELTTRLEAITTARLGGRHDVRPEIVLEVTFDIVQPSERHGSGFALRFPRIVRIRDDKPPSEVDTLARVRELAGV